MGAAIAGDWLLAALPGVALPALLPARGDFARRPGDNGGGDGRHDGHGDGSHGDGDGGGE